MAGHRRIRNTSGTEAAQRTTRPERRRAALAAKWATTQSAAERAVVAAGYLRGARARHQPNAALTAQVDHETDELAQAMVRLGDRLLAGQAKERLTARTEGTP